MVILADAADAQFEELVTVKLYVPGSRPEIVAFIPVPVVVIPPGFLVSVHVPDAGKLAS